MDEQLFFLINSNHTPFFDTLMFLITQKTVWIPLYISLLYVVWRNYSWKGVFGIAVMIGVSMFFTDWFLSHCLREWIGRLRPNNPDNPIFPQVHIVWGKHGAGYGFPSAHSANIWMVTIIVWHWVRQRWLTLSMVVLSLLFCYSRVYLGFHYPGDILGGLVYALLVTIPVMWYHNRKWHFQPQGTRHWWLPSTIIMLTLISFAITAAITPN